MSVGLRITYGQLMGHHKRIRVPLIQRDFAQGRPDETEVRDEFLTALENALLKPPTDESLPLNLDFVYGSVEGDDPSFLPLDGQQRLTTLFLMHWYLAWVDAGWDQFQNLFLSGDGTSRFTYRVRPSSTDFFDAFVAFRPGLAVKEVASLSAYIQDQSWYYRSWRLDPTIQSVLGMLDAIHARFRHSEGLFERLTDSRNPAITFQLLDLDNFGLSDDLYIKMNARGKPLTPFETFKARYEQELESQLEGTTFPIGTLHFSAAEYVSRRLDTTWGDLFWSLRDPKSDSSDAALMNLFRAVALVSRDPESGNYLQDVAPLRSPRGPTYSDFHQHGWLDDQFTLTLIRLLDSWRAQGGKLAPLLPSSRYFDEAGIFSRVATGGGNLSYVDAVQFAAYTLYVLTHHGGVQADELERWMRVVYNLSVNTGYNRLEDLRRSFVGLGALVSNARRIEEYLADPDSSVTGFSEPQIAEERLKAQLMLAEPSWRSLLEAPEAHGYFRGQIEFLLDFSGVNSAASAELPDSWDKARHDQLQSAVNDQWRMAALMFNGNGLADLGAFRWQRALLSVGDYLLPSGRNRSFLVNSITEEASWKRLLRGGVTAQRRDILRQLWALLKPDQPLQPQLETVISEALGLEHWRSALAQTPAAMAFCERNCLRWIDNDVYLLKRSQLNGTHAELLTYCLYTKLGFKPADFPRLRLGYNFVMDATSAPSLSITAESGDSTISFKLYRQTGRFVIYGSDSAVDAVPGLKDELIARGFTAADAQCFKWSDQQDMLDLLGDVDQAFSAVA